MVQIWPRQATKWLRLTRNPNHAVGNMFYPSQCSRWNSPSCRKLGTSGKPWIPRFCVESKQDTITASFASRYEEFTTLEFARTTDCRTWRTANWCANSRATEMTASWKSWPVSRRKTLFGARRSSEPKWSQRSNTRFQHGTNSIRLRACCVTPCLCLARGASVPQTMAA